MSDERIVVGVHPVRELLRAGTPVERILIDRDRTESDEVADLRDRAGAAGITIEEVHRQQVAEQAHGLVHQGVLAVAPPFAYTELAEVLARPGVLVALDGITDPHNVGSIARTAEAVGAAGLVVTRRRAAGVTPTVEKAAAGALAHLPVVQVTNLVRALEACRDAGRWIIGLEADGELELADSNLLDEPLVLVVGSEGEGLARLTAERCDQRVRLPLRGQVASLNASVAAAVALYEIVRHQPA